MTLNIEKSISNMQNDFKLPDGNLSFDWNHNHTQNTNSPIFSILNLKVFFFSHFSHWICGGMLLAE